MIVFMPRLTEQKFREICLSDREHDPHMITGVGLTQAAYIGNWFPPFRRKSSIRKEVRLIGKTANFAMRR